MATRHWSEVSPLRSRIRLGTSRRESGAPSWGVVGDVRNDDIDAPPLPHVYVPLAQRPSREMALVVRTADDPCRTRGASGLRWLVVDRNQPLYDVRTMTQVLTDDLRHRASRRIGRAVCDRRAGAAATGIYGVIAHVVAQPGTRSELNGAGAAAARWSGR
jgi:putative ABC transport system permease protein